MKDIDFDELDKAVNSLMTKSQKEASAQAPASPDATAAQDVPASDEPGIPITAAAPVIPGAIKPKSTPAINPDAQPAVMPQPKNDATAQRSTTPAARRGGRFMDMMPKKSATPPVSRAASREGVAISPRVGLDVEPETAKLTQPTADTKEAPQVQHSVTEKVAPKSDWPDPIEIATAKKPPVAEKQPESEKPEEKPAVQQSPSKEEEASESRPLTSPFLPGAKVEKRPLGAPASNLPMIAPEAELQAPAPDDSEAQLPAQPSDVEPEAPVEFGNDIMQVEADTHMGMPKTDDHEVQHPPADSTFAPSQATGTVTPKQEDKPEEKPASKAKVTDKAEELTMSSSDSPGEAPSASGRISIPPQYKEQPSTGEKESGAIYDTSTYHQPLAHPAKKKSGWLWVLWIVLILIVGAGAGVALYFLGIM